MTHMLSLAVVAVRGVAFFVSLGRVVFFLLGGGEGEVLFPPCRCVFLGVAFFVSPWQG